MAVKHIELPLIGTVKLYKRKGSRSIRLSIAHDGSVRVSMPTYVPYQAGLQFVRNREQWITRERQHAQHPLRTGDKIGKAHHLELLASPMVSRVTTRLNGSIVLVTYPMAVSSAANEVQAAAQKAALRALKQEAQTLLPQRLRILANKGGFTYSAVSFKQLKSRWGSCNSKQELTFNIFLMQLPWELIDYVIYHELTHTKVLHHGPNFWHELERHVPKAKQLRKAIRAYHPVITS